MIKRIAGVMIVLILLMFAGNFLIVKCVADTFNEENEALKELVGEEVIIKGDTLMVLDYSILNGTVTLDDGREVSTELVKKLIKEDNE